MSVGRLIKAERKKKGIKQINLARGICSISYLSKIENDNISPNQEIINLLLKRLDITRNDSLDSEKSDLLNELKENYKNLIINREISKFNAEELPEYYFNKSNDINIEYCIYLMRILLSKEIYDKVAYLLELINEKKIKENKLLFIFLVNKGIFLLNNRKVKEAIDIFDKALFNCNNTQIEEWERADLYYIYALANISLLNLHKALDYIKISQEYFSKESLFKRSIENTIVEANIYKRFGEYQKVEKLFTSALKISKLLKDRNYIGIINQNLGDLYFRKGDQNNALSFYLESLKYKSNKSDKLITILSLIEVYEKEKNKDKILYWNNYGITLLTKSENLTMQEQFYKKCFNMNEITYNSKIIEKIKEVNSILDFLEYNSYFNYSYKYASRIADFLSESRKYKLANYYYKISIRNFYNEKNFKGVENI